MLLTVSLVIALVAFAAIIVGLAVFSTPAGVSHEKIRDGFDFADYNKPPTIGDIVSSSPDGRHYVRRVPIEYPNGTQVLVQENIGSADPSYGQLVSFLRDDWTEHGLYSLDNVCTNFAVRLYDEAQGSGMKAHIVEIWFADGGNPHVIVAFNTTDRGLIYVDDTGRTQKQKEAGQMDIDRIVTLEPGQPYTTHFLPPFDGVNDTASLGIVKSVKFFT